MKNDNDNQWLDPILEQHIRREPKAFDFEKWTETHPDEARLLRSGFNDSSQSTKTKTFEIWRFIMESKVTRYSAAAVIILATTFVLFGPSWAPGNGNVVLADVQQKVAGVETMVIRGTKTFTRPGKDSEVFEFDGTKCVFDLLKYHSTRYGLVEEGYAEGQLFYRITLNIPEEQTLIVLPKYKKYLKFASMGALAKVMEYFTTPNGILNLLLEGDYTKLGRDKIDGIEVEAFEFQDTEPFELFKELLPKAVFNIQAFKAKVWVGIKEQLPVRIEGDLSIGKSIMTAFNDLNLHEVNTLREYNVEIDEAVFDTSPPEGYTELTLSDILQVIPTEAKAGLVGLGIIPAGFVVWRRRGKKKRTTTKQ